MERGLVTSIHNIFYDSELYEVTVRDNIIITVSRFTSDGRFRRILTFDDLPVLVQCKILTELSNAETS